MRAKTINENIENILKPKDLNDNEKILWEIKDALKTLGIGIRYFKKSNPVPPYGTKIEISFYDEGLMVYTKNHGIVSNFKGLFISSEDLDEDWWYVFDSSDVTIIETTDPSNFIKTLVKIKYGTLDAVQEKIDEKQQIIDLLTKVKEVYES